MLKHNLIRVAVLAAVSGAASTSHAHFKLLTPASWLTEDSTGGPQKGSPCGIGGSDDVNPPPMSGKVTEYKAGEEIEVTWVDTIAHPGHFRIALAENRTDLKDPTIQQDSFCSYDEAMVPKAASGNVLADGVSFRSRTGFSAAAGTMFSQKVKLPNTPCDKCTLQVMQIMENDLQSISNCYYFHCADIKILPAAGGAAGSGAAGAAAAGAGGASTAGASAAGSTAAAGGVSGGSAGSSGSVAGAASRAGSPATATAGSAAAGTLSTAAGAPASTVAGSMASVTAGMPATGTTTNAATGAPAASTDSSGCSVSGVGATRGAASSVVMVSAMFLLNLRRRRRELRKRSTNKASDTRR
jgi:hypothetical protein